MKYCIDKYPKGSYKGQHSDGKYMDKNLHKNLRIMAKRITDDLTFMGIISSSTLEVGTGKSVFATQLGEAWTELIKIEHGIELPYNVDNLVWRPKDLIDRAFEVPKYSCLILDEWEDSTYWSELGMSLRQFFRKCRQLNLFILVIIPNFFQMPMSYAISRSAFFIDVKFGDNFTRGNFSFYSFGAKRGLYIRGKRNHDYRVVRPSFYGKFIDGYGVDEQEYRKRKLEDMKKYDEEMPVKLTKSQIEKEKSLDIYANLLKNFPEKTSSFFEKIMKVSKKTITNWKKELKERGVVPK